MNVIRAPLARNAGKKFRTRRRRNVRALSPFTRRGSLASAGSDGLRLEPLVERAARPDDRLLALRAGREKRDAGADGLLERAHVLARAAREGLEGLHAPG